MLSYWKKRLLIGVLSFLLIVITVFFVVIATTEKGDWFYYTLYKIVPGLVIQRSVRTCPEVLIRNVSYGPPTWEYQMFFLFPKRRLKNINIKAGSTWSIGATGVESASVNGEAALPEFGAWRVEKITTKGVGFEATQDAVVSQSFSGFSITAPKSVTGKMWWLPSFAGASGGREILGPVNGF